MTKHSIYTYFFFCAIAIIYVLFFIVGWGQFHLWDQVLALRGYSIGQLHFMSQAHYLRYLLVYPIFYLADCFNLVPDWLFSCIIAGLTVLTAMNIARTALLYTGHHHHLNLYRLFSLLAMINFASFMNGRMMFSLFGVSLLLKLMTQWDRKLTQLSTLLMGTVSALLLNSVSTGAFMVVVLLFYGWLFAISHPVPSTKLKWLSIGLLVLLLPIIKLYLFKNIEFFGGGFLSIFHMLHHGLGIIFYKFNWPVLVLLASLALIVLAIASYLFYTGVVYRPLILAIYTSAGCGLFGLSTFATGVPAFVLVLMVLADIRHIMPARTLITT